MNPLVKPILKWAGGKRQLLPEIRKHLPQACDYTYYYEPFIGGGAVLFDFQPSKAVINDTNPELINLYKVIKENADALIEDLKKHQNEKEYFYKIRALDRDKDAYAALSKIERASRIIYLNRTCFNGLFRVNLAGEFNTPFGNYKKPNIVDEVTIKAIHHYFDKTNVSFYNEDFLTLFKRIKKSSFVYFDPPYDPVSNSANFTGYSPGGFKREDQIRLKALCDRLHTHGVKFLLSNSATPFIKDLYKDYNITVIRAKRLISANADNRDDIDEVLIKNYE